MTAEERKIASMLNLMSELCRILKRENTLLTQQRQKECAALFEQKDKLSAAYAESFAYFSDHREIFSALNATQKATIRKAAKTLSALTDENARLLKINIDATDRLLNAVIRDVKEQSADTPHYTPDGLMDENASNPTAISFNQVL